MSERGRRPGPRQPREGGPHLRLFVAIELPGAWLAALQAMQDQLRRTLEAPGWPRPRWVRPEGIHLTLKFLGETPEASRARIEEALASAVPEILGVRLRLGGAGTFSDRGSPRVIWVSVGGDTDGLARVASQVEAALAPLGFPTERRPFAAHLTLARVPDPVPQPDRQRYHGAIAAAGPPSDLPDFNVEKVSLMLSRLGPGGARYERLAAFPR